MLSLPVPNLTIGQDAGYRLTRIDGWGRNRNAPGRNWKNRNAQMSEESQAAAQHDRPLWPKPGRRWFPFVWLTVAAVVWAGFQFSDTTRDFKWVISLIVFVTASIGLLIWYLFRGRAKARVRWAVLLVPLLLVGLGGALIKFENDGDGRFIGWKWAWTPAHDEQLQLPEASNEPPSVVETAADGQASYPAFLGGGYWAEASGIEPDDNWQSNPPVEVWRQPIGAGWSSFAIVRGLAVTQEQRGPNELVVAYRVADGKVAWLHKDEARFDVPGTIESMGGIGPRATPTIHEGKVFTHGATGIVNCLDLDSGKLIWSVNCPQQFQTDVLRWGMSGSPLVIPGQQDAPAAVVIGVGAPYGADGTTDFDASLVAFDTSTGKVIWSAGNRITSYASPVLAKVAGREQILQVNQDFLTSHDARDGTILWEAPWPGSSYADASCSQPVPLPGDRVFLSKGYGIGSMMLEVQSEGDNLVADQLWRRNVLKTKFGNVVVKDGYAYGIDGIHLQCINLETGKSEWKKRRRPVFGHGQIMLVDGRLLILSESGELILAEASPEKYVELAALQALNPDEISWSNPALAGDMLLLRNSKEAVCLRMPVLGETPN